MKNNSSLKYFFSMGIAVLGSGAILAVLDGKAAWIEGWLGYSTLLGMAAIGILGTWKMVRGDRSVGVAAVAAFLIRLSFGVFFMMILPAAGYQDNQASQLGYLYKDAFIRDQQAWSLAASGSPLLDAFSGTYSGDQYGGLLGLSALVYRYLGFGDHRPWLVLILTAMVSSMGVLWLWKAAKEWLGSEDLFTRSTGKWAVGFFFPITAAWIVALYPEAVFLGAAHIRESFVMACIALSLYSLTQVNMKPRSWWVGFVLAVAILFLFQLPALIGSDPGFGGTPAAVIRAASFLENRPIHCRCPGVGDSPGGLELAEPAFTGVFQSLEHLHNLAAEQFRLPILPGGEAVRDGAKTDPGGGQAVEPADHFSVRLCAAGASSNNRRSGGPFLACVQYPAFSGLVYPGISVDLPRGGDPLSQTPTSAFDAHLVEPGGICLDLNRSSQCWRRYVG